MTKAALDLLGLPGGAVRAPLLAATEAETTPAGARPHRGRREAAGTAHARDRRVSHPHPDLARPAARAQRPAHRPARRARRDRPEHDGLRVPRPPAHRGLRRAVPRPGPARRGPDPAGLRLPGGPARPGRGGRPHARARGPHRRGPVPAQGAPGHPAGRLQADPGPGAEQAGRAPPRPGHGRGGRGQPQLVRPVRLRVPRGQPLDPRRARRGHPDPGRPGAAHRRLQDGPAAAGRQAHRPGRLRPARHRGRRPADGRLDQRRGARRGDLRARHRAGARRDLRQHQAAHHRGLLRLARAPGAAGAQRRGQAPAQGRLRRPVHGPQHGRRPRPRLPAGARRPPGRPARGRGDAARRRGADLHRLAGRADVGAVPDGRPRPPDQDRRRGHRHPGLLADPGQRDRGVPGDQRADPARRAGGAQGLRAGARVRARPGRRAALRAEPGPAAQLHAGARRVAAPAGARRSSPRWPACRRTTS